MRAPHDRRTTAPRRTRRPLQRIRTCRRRRQAPPPPTCGRVRLPLGARVRAGRVAPPGALADERAPRAAHGEGARGHGPRRGGRVCSTAIPRAPWAPHLDSSFDAAVRAAGSILQTHAARGRGATLVTTGSDGQVVPVRSSRGELGSAVTCLAAACADARHGLARVLHANPSLAGTAELVIVTATLDPAAFSAVLAVGCTASDVARMGRRCELRGSPHTSRRRPAAAGGARYPDRGRAEGRRSGCGPLRPRPRSGGSWLEPLSPPRSPPLPSSSRGLAWSRRRPYDRRS